ncbi:relaxase/mobilization nuclease domain-containing protein [Treponema sp.]|uniref:relaxase/mobilization nuclease domain-containing protein n=1 Tax=Treponema sp. TaxID=166 RepID=UPI00298E7C27|nr:relaxase/mobilization nuclease domain-containing protein [Treponema sp.]MCR5613237.1 relaxase/mobilization nuclease domain-containing protein [Treponema sp.]
MAILKIVNAKKNGNASLKGIINYVLKPEKTTEKLSTGLFCDVSSAYKTMLETKSSANKTKGRQYYHFVQSFPPVENITPSQVHELGVEFASKCKKFFGFEMLVVTHADRVHLHNHILLNSVSFINNKKFQMSRSDLRKMKELQNEICIAHGFSPAPKKGFNQYGFPKKKSFVANSMRLFQQIIRRPKDSYVNQCATAVEKSIEMSRSREQFILLMKAQGFETEWNEKKKHITFTDIKRKESGEKKFRVRLKKLSQYFSNLSAYTTKEELLNGLTNKCANRVTSSRGVVGAINSNSRQNAADSRDSRVDSKVIDFNTGFEQYLASSHTTNSQHSACKTSSDSGRIFKPKPGKSTIVETEYRQRIPERTNLLEKNNERNQGDEGFDR